MLLDIKDSKFSMKKLKNIMVLGVGVKGFFLGPIFKSMWLPIFLKDFSLNYVKMAIFLEFSHFSLIAAIFSARIRQNRAKIDKNHHSTQ